MGKVHVTCSPLSDTHTFSRVVVLVGEGQSYAWKCAKTVKVSATAEGCMSMSSYPVLFSSVSKALWPLSKLAVILLGFSICNLLLCHLCHTPCVHTPFTPPFYLSWLLCLINLTSTPYCSLGASGSPRCVLLQFQPASQFLHILFPVCSPKWICGVVAILKSRLTASWADCMCWGHGQVVSILTDGRLVLPQMKTTCEGTVTALLHMIVNHGKCNNMTK